VHHGCYRADSPGERGIQDSALTGEEEEAEAEEEEEEEEAAEEEDAAPRPPE